LEGKAEVHKPAEEEADAFARDNLISLDDYAAFVAAGDFDPRPIVDFAAAVGVHPGIVVGRLQYEGNLPRNRCNSLRVLYDFQADESTSAA
jgi:hypothetical protein